MTSESNETFWGLHAWVDNNDSKEAGNSIAFLNYEFKETDKNLLITFKKALKKMYYI